MSIVTTVEQYNTACTNQDDIIRIAGDLGSINPPTHPCCIQVTAGNGATIGGQNRTCTAGIGRYCYNGHTPAGWRYRVCVDCNQTFFVDDLQYPDQPQSLPCPDCDRDSNQV